MNLNMRFTTVFWVGLALVANVSQSQASSSDLVQATADGSATGSVAGNADVSAAPMTLGAAPQSRPDFSGHWILNAKASDDPQEKTKEAMKAMQQAKGGGHGKGGSSGGQGRGGGMGGGMGSGMGGGRHGRRSSDEMGGRGEMPSRELSALMVTSEKLDILHEDPMLLIVNENGQRQRLFTDFRGASVSASGGLQQRISIAGWEGAALVVETTMTGGSRLVQNYQVDAKTGQLMIITAANLPERQAVSYRLVYDRVKHGADAGSR